MKHCYVFLSGRFDRTICAALCDGEVNLSLTELRTNYNQMDPRHLEQGIVGHKVISEVISQRVTETESVLDGP